MYLCSGVSLHLFDESRLASGYVCMALLVDMLVLIEGDLATCVSRDQDDEGVEF